MPDFDRLSASPVNCAIFDNLEADDIFRFLRVSKWAQLMAMDYVERRYSLLAILRRFFDEDGALAFWKLMASTGLLISGSAAVQLFDRTVYPESDLDLYVHEHKAHDVTRWLQNVGYVAEVYSRDGDDVYQLISGRIDPLPQEDSFASFGGYGYGGASMVLTFLHPLSRKIIHLVTAKVSPLQVILRFHSTVVLNVISYSKAYSLYPRATFVERRGVLVSTPYHRNSSGAVRKYMRRGWLLDRRLSPEEVYDPRSRFATGVRHFGDSQCWTLPLRPVTDFNIISPYDVEQNRWLTYTGPTNTLKLHATLLTSPRLEFGYFFSPCVSLREIRRRFESLKAEIGGTVYLDMLCGHLMED